MINLAQISVTEFLLFCLVTTLKILLLSILVNNGAIYSLLEIESSSVKKWAWLSLGEVEPGFLKPGFFQPLTC